MTQQHTASGGTYLDLHVHSSDGSDDAGGTVEGYLKWIQAKRGQGYRLDGFVLTEHRNYQPDRDYSALAERYDAVVLRGVEVETDVGHVLVFGVTPEFLQAFDVSKINLPYADVFRVAWETGGVAIGAHAGRSRIGIVDHFEDRTVDLAPVTLIEGLNGGSSDYENARGHELALEHSIGEVGASDSHFVSALGRAMTRFEGDIRTLDDLVAALRDPAHPFSPIRLEETKPGAVILPRPTASALIPATSRMGELSGDEVKYDQSVIGKEKHVGTLEVSMESIRHYCEAIGETSPLYLDQKYAEEEGQYGFVVAPPGILQTATLLPGPDPKIEFDGTGFLAGTRQEFFFPIRPGDSIEAYAQVKEIYEKTGRSGRMVFVVRRTRYQNQHGEDVAAIESSAVMRQVKAVGGNE